MRVRSLSAGRRGCALTIAFLCILPAAWTVQAQGTSEYFAPTGQTVSGLFLQYWQTHGGLAQQGYPLSGEFTEVSDLNGKPYTVQYFERAVFELHPENAPPYNVLLSQLGAFRYQAKYPQGAPDQHANQTAGHFFAETGHWVGGKFWAYWQSHGGLAQQGYPLSDEFTEVSDLNGKPYTVQYFERAVFELHPENAPPFDVLLSQLGTFRLHQKYPAGAPTPQPTTLPAPVATPGLPPPVPTAIRDLLAKSDTAMNALTSMKAHSVNSTTDAGSTTVDYADYQFQAPDRQYIKVTSPRPGQPDAIAEVIRIGQERFQRSGPDTLWTHSTDPTAFHWPEYNKVYAADHALAVTLAEAPPINGVPVQVVAITLPVSDNPTQGTQTIQYFISTIDYRDLREVTTVPAFPPGRTASGLYTSEFSAFDVPNAINAPANVRP